MTRNRDWRMIVAFSTAVATIAIAGPTTRFVPN
jgi:hypothetical protein